LSRFKKKFHKYKVSDSAKRSADGIVFASRLEMRVYLFLKKTIGLKNFSLQPSYELQPGFRRNGKAIRAIKYVSDFLVKDGDEELVVDAKGMVTPVFKIKQKMFIHKFDKDIHLLKTKKDMVNFARSLKNIDLLVEPESI